MPRNTAALASRLSEEDRTAWRALQAMPNIGPAMALDLLRLGVRSEEDLLGKDPDDLYDRLGRLDGVRHDPCVHDTFAAAISFAETGEPLPWWHFSAERKGRAVAP